MRGAWIEMQDGDTLYTVPRSLPVRGAWIEIPMLSVLNPEKYWSLPVRGAWIEIFAANGSIAKYASRSPCGERGLKS